MSPDEFDYWWGIVVGWFCGGLSMLTYLHWQHLIRTKTEWEAYMKKEKEYATRTKN